jgi:hypothetical protein
MLVVVSRMPLWTPGRPALPAALVVGPWLLVVEVVAAALLLEAVLPLTRAPVPVPVPAVGFVLPNIWPSTTAL